MAPNPDNPLNIGKATSKVGGEVLDEEMNPLERNVPADDASDNFFQLSGHPNTLTAAGPGMVRKKISGSDKTEAIVYEELSQDPILCDIIPRYFGEVECEGEKYIELQNLLNDFRDPSVMDIKMGTRTFLESEMKNTKARADLYKKMVAIDPQGPTEEEHQNKAVSKIRYMRFREMQSSTYKYGFRIEAVKCKGADSLTDLQKVKTDVEVADMLRKFLGGAEEVKAKLLTKLTEIRTKIDQTNYFKTREVVGSSLLIVYEGCTVGVWLIDFAKTKKLPEGLTVNHRAEWVQGNHEDGLLLGFDNLISIMEGLNLTADKPNNNICLADADTEKS